MEIKPIHTENDYQEALKIASYFFDNEPEPNTPEGNTFDILLTLIESYEAKNFPISSPDPIEAIKFRLEQIGKDVKALSPIIGRMNRVYEVMSRKRALTLGMIRRIHVELGVPAESLIMQDVIIHHGERKPATRLKKHLVSPSARATKHSSVKKVYI